MIYHLVSAVNAETIFMRDKTKNGKIKNISATTDRL